MLEKSLVFSRSIYFAVIQYWSNTLWVTVYLSSPHPPFTQALFSIEGKEHPQWVIREWQNRFFAPKPPTHVHLLDSATRHIFSAFGFPLKALRNVPQALRVGQENATTLCTEIPRRTEFVVRLCGPRKPVITRYRRRFRNSLTRKSPRYFFCLPPLEFDFILCFDCIW